jgi:hypothetical protein
MFTSLAPMTSHIYLEERKARNEPMNISDCESSLEQEVEWLRRKFPYSRFTLKEFTAS